MSDDDTPRMILTPDAALRHIRDILAAEPGLKWSEIYRRLVAVTGARISQRVLYKWKARYSWDVHLHRVRGGATESVRSIKSFVADMQVMARACTEGQVIEGVAGKLIVRLGETIDLLAPTNYDDLAKALDCVDRLLAQAHTARGLKFDRDKSKLEHGAVPQLRRDQGGDGKVILPNFSPTARAKPTTNGGNGHG